MSGIMSMIGGDRFFVLDKYKKEKEKGGKSAFDF